MAEEVSLVGSRVSQMHLAYDCPGCGGTVAVSIIDGKDSSGERCLIQRPGDCPECGRQIHLPVTTQAGSRSGRTA
jgi:hypothetical protein